MDMTYRIQKGNELYRYQDRVGHKFIRITKFQQYDEGTWIQVGNWYGRPPNQKSELITSRANARLHWGTKVNKQGFKEVT